MGNYLASPDTKKNFLESKNAKLKYTACSMQGWRISMEDAEICDLSLSNGNVQCFGVFDGHGGKEVAWFVKKNFVKELQSNKNYLSGNYKVALKETFMKMDVLLESPQGQKQLQTFQGSNSDGAQSRAGCTANVILITPQKIYCANAGDSRAVMSKQGSAIPLSVDHKPQDDKERDRIIKAGGEVWEGRVNGNLNLSRAIGDLEYKQNKTIPPNQQLIIAEPDIQEYDLIKNSPEFIVMGCDGIWESLPNQAVISYFEKQLKIKTSRKCVEDFLDSILAKNTEGMYGLDNMTCILIQFFK